MNMNTQYPAEVFQWMITSMQTVPLFYGTIPVKELYKVFQSGKDEYPGHDGAPGVGDISEKDYTEMLRGLLSIANRPGFAGTPGLAAAGISCKFDGNELVPIGADDLVKAVRAGKRKASFLPEGYRILTHDEVMQVLTKGYVETAETTAMENYLKSRWKKSEEDAVGLVRHMVIGFRTTEDSPEDAVNELSHILGTNKKENAITPDELMEMLNAVLQVYQVTGMMDRCGWAPNELYEKLHGQKAPDVKSSFNLDPNASPLGAFDNLKPGSKIVPGSSHMAAFLKEHEAELKARGIEVDYEASASMYRDTRVTPEGTTQRTRGQKVYPNDPCPCGSGLKYRDCHGRG